MQGAKRNAADGGVQRVKRQAVAPARIHGGDLKAEMKEAKKLIKELMAHRSGWPFNKPVDITLFPQYTSVIANPMDLRTIDRKIDSNQYGTLDGFATDLKLVWSNCYQFNQDPTADVNIMAKELESIADERLLRIPEELEEKRATKAEDGQSDLKKQLREQKKRNDEMYAMMQQQQSLINMMPMQQGMMQQGMMQQGMMPMMGGMNPMMQQAPMAQAAAPAPRGRGRGRAPGGGRGRGRGAASTALVAADPFAAAQPQRLPPSSAASAWDIRTKISTNCEKMNSKETSQVIEIIKRVMPSIGNNGEIELDMNALDNTTLWTLWDFFEDNAAAKAGAAGKKKGRPSGGGGRAAPAYQQPMMAAPMQNTMMAAPQQGYGADDDWVNEGDSDDGFGGGSAAAAGGGGGYSSAMYQGFQNARQQQQQAASRQQQRQMQQQNAAQQEQQNARLAQQQAAASKQAQLEAQRAAERAKRQAQGGVDMLGQSNMMSSFEQGGGDDDDLAWDVDEFGHGGF